MTTEPRHYLAYTLRLWQTGDEGDSTWQAFLESPHTGERRGFANLEALVAFLEEYTCGCERRPQAKNNGVVEPGIQSYTS
jgi:hypothetical protein